MDDPYWYPGTRVLRNKEDIRDEHALEEFERRAARNRAEMLAGIIRGALVEYVPEIQQDAKSPPGNEC